MLGRVGGKVPFTKMQDFLSEQNSVTGASLNAPSITKNTVLLHLFQDYYTQSIF